MRRKPDAPKQGKWGPGAEGFILALIEGDAAVPAVIRDWLADKNIDLTGLIGTYLMNRINDLADDIRIFSKKVCLDRRNQVGKRFSRNRWDWYNRLYLAERLGDAGLTVFDASIWKASGPATLDRQTATCVFPDHKWSERPQTLHVLMTLGLDGRTIRDALRALGD